MRCEDNSIIKRIFMVRKEKFVCFFIYDNYFYVIKN